MYVYIYIHIYSHIYMCVYIYNIYIIYAKINKYINLSLWFPKLGNDPDAYRPGGDIHDALLTSSPSSAVIDTFPEVKNRHWNTSEYSSEVVCRSFFLLFNFFRFFFPTVQMRMKKCCNSRFELQFIFYSVFLVHLFRLI